MRVWLNNCFSNSHLTRSETTTLKCAKDRLRYRDHPHTACLRFIDPYGDATFNQLHLPVLLEELRVLQRSAGDAEAKLLLAALIRYVQKAKGQVHTYVRFIGD